MKVKKSTTDKFSVIDRCFKIIDSIDDRPTFYIVEACTSEGGLRQILADHKGMYEDNMIVSITEVSFRTYDRYMKKLMEEDETENEWTF